MHQDTTQTGSLFWTETNLTWTGIGGSEIDGDVVALAYTTSLSLE